MMLEVKGLTTGYGEIQVLWDVDVAVSAGEIVALVGANGAGKTTLLRSLMGLNPVWSGSIRFEGRDLTGMSTQQRVRSGMIMVPERRRLFGGLTVEANLLLGAYIRDRDGVRDDLELIYALFPALHDRRRQVAGSLSGGEQQMCAIGRALMGRPRLLLVDEVSLGLAPLVVESLMAGLAKVRQESRTTFLLVEQDVQMALEVADRGYVLEVGRIVLSGPAAELIARPEVRTAYLGL